MAAGNVMRRLLCSFRGHQWHIEENYATQGTEQDCVRCGAHRPTFPGDPAFRQPIRPAWHPAQSMTSRTAREDDLHALRVGPEFSRGRVRRV